MSKGKTLAFLQKLGKSLMIPVAVMPAAAILLRLGQPDVLNWPWMAAAGNAIFGNLAIIFAIGIAVGFAEENNGVAAIAAAVGYFVLTQVAVTFDKNINMGVLAGILSGIVAGLLYNKYKAVKLPDFLGFFGGRRFVPIVTSFASLIMGVIAGFVWPLIQNAINAFGNAVVGLGALGAFFFGLLNRLLIPFGLHHVVNSLFWFQFGTFTDKAGKLVSYCQINIGNFSKYKFYYKMFMQIKAFILKIIDVEIHISSIYPIFRRNYPAFSVPHLYHDFTQECYSIFISSCRLSNLFNYFIYRLIHKNFSY